MAAYCRIYDSRHLQADCQAPGSAPEPYARQSSTGCFYLFRSRKGGGLSQAVSFLTILPLVVDSSHNLTVTNLYCLLAEAHAYVQLD